MLFENNIVDQLKRHEGLRLTPYQCTSGKLTIGYGRNLEDVGISHNEASMLLSNDVNKAVVECENNFYWFKDLNDPRKAVIINMVFNLGMRGFSKFKNTIHHISLKQYKEASLEMASSLWAKQVKGRSVELCQQMLTGEFA